MRGIRALAALLMTLGAVGFAGTADAFGNDTACVDMGFGDWASTECNVPPGSRLYVSSEAKSCVSPVTENIGEVHFVEASGTIVERLPIPDIDWWDVRRLNEHYAANILRYEGEVRFFWRQCYIRSARVGITLDDLPIAVPITDVLLDIRIAAASVALSIPLPDPVLSTLPGPDDFYGLKVNNPAWIAVTPASWRTVVEGPRALRGWPVTLVIRPAGLEFAVSQGDQSIRVSCDPGAERYVPGSSRFPSEPMDFTDDDNWFDPPEDPLPSRACSWTPRRKGPGTVTVSITYTVLVDAGGRLFEFAPRTNTAVVPIEVTELRTVNLRPGV